MPGVASSHGSMDPCECAYVVGRGEWLDDIIAQATVVGAPAFGFIVKGGEVGAAPDWEEEGKGARACALALQETTISFFLE